MRETIGTIHVPRQDIGAISATVQKTKAIRTHKSAKRKRGEGGEIESRSGDSPKKQKNDHDI